MTMGDNQLVGQWGIQHNIHGSREQLAEAICQGIAIAVSNGSFQDQQGAAAVEGYDKNNRILGKGSTPGSATDQSAYRSELFGLWGIFKALQQFCQESNIQSRHIQVACNGLSTLHQAQSRKPVNPVAPHYNFSTQQPRTKNYSSSTQPTCDTRRGAVESHDDHDNFDDGPYLSPTLPHSFGKRHVLLHPEGVA